MPSSKQNLHFQRSQYDGFLDFLILIKNSLFEITQRLVAHYAEEGRGFRSRILTCDEILIHLPKSEQRVARNNMFQRKGTM